MKTTTDIDLDVADRKKVLAVIPHIPAMMSSRGKPEAHNTGVYLQNIPQLKNGLASMEYGLAEDIGYFKLDFINNSIYSEVKDIDHLQSLTVDPIWGLLDDKEFVSNLAHIHGHFDVVETIKPQSVIDLAIVLALIRPGKRHLLNYPRYEIDANVWSPPEDGTYYFKKAHAVAFALSIVIQMNLLVEKLTNE